MDITALELRVSTLEKGFAVMESKIKDVEQTLKHTDKTAVEARLYASEAAANSAEAVAMLSAAKGVGGFIAKHGPRVIAAIVGVMAYKGLIDTNLASQLAQIFGT